MSALKILDTTSARFGNDFHRIAILLQGSRLGCGERNGIDFPAICNHGRCLTCAGRLIGEGKFDQSASESYFSEDLDAGFVRFWSALPQSNSLVSTHQQDLMRQHRRKLGLPAPCAQLPDAIRRYFLLNGERRDHTADFPRQIIPHRNVHLVLPRGE